MGACGSGESHQRRGDGANADAAKGVAAGSAAKPGAKSGHLRKNSNAWIGGADDKAKNKIKKVKKADKVSAFESPKMDETPGKIEDKSPHADEKKTEGINPTKENVEVVQQMQKLTLNDVRPKGKLVAGKSAREAENSPGRAAPGFLATPGQSPQNAPMVSDDTDMAKERFPKNEEDKKQPAKNESTEKSPAKLQKVFFQKPTYEADDEVDDLPCEVLSSNIPHKLGAQPLFISKTDEEHPDPSGINKLPSMESQVGSSKPTRKDFLRKGASNFAFQARGTKKLAPLNPLKGVRVGGAHKLKPLGSADLKKSSKEFRDNLKKLKKSGSRKRRLERYMVKKLSFPSKAAELVLEYAAIKVSTLSKFAETDVVADEATKLEEQKRREREKIDTQKRLLGPLDGKSEDKRPVTRGGGMMAALAH